MKPSEVRRRILDEHARLRGLLAEVQSLVERVLEGHGEAVELLRERGRALHTFFFDHLELEDVILVATLRDADAWGEERARNLTQEHREQRQLLEALLGRIDDARLPAEELARDLADFVQRVREDMAVEEKAMLSDKILRDDVISIDAETG
jgi:hemerythrin-like domain-containing protein